MKRIAFGIVAATALAAPIVLAAGSANASVLVNDEGKGFIGKGDVQTAFGLNNAAIQKIIDKDVNAFTFTSEQPAAQSLTQSATQVGTQSATQSAHRVLSCTVTVGGEKNQRVFEADGTRDGVKTGTREGSRTGTRTGSLDGSLAAGIDAKARKTGQWTGWNVTGFTSGPSFTATGDAVFGAVDFGGYLFDGEYAFGDVEWGGWVAAPGENPADCLRNDNGAEVTDLQDVTTYGDVVPGEVEDGATTYGATEVGPTTATGPAKVFATYGGVTRGL